MCQEVFKIIQNMDRRNVETNLAIQCAPLITGIKISNLLIVSKANAGSVPYVLRKTGLVFLMLTQMEKNVTFLIFRRQELCIYLQNPHVQRILLENGYKDLSFGSILRTFICRYQAYADKQAEFPHEMGVFLGYPVEDVEGFIVHKGQNYLYSGYWKVYADVSAKQQMFQEYEDAQRDVITLLAEGMDIRRIIEYYSGGGYYNRNGMTGMKGRY